MYIKIISLLNGPNASQFRKHKMKQTKIYKKKAYEIYMLLCVCVYILKKKKCKWLPQTLSNFQTQLFFFLLHSL